MAFLCNENMLINFVPVAVPPDAIYAGDQGLDLIKIVGVKSTKVKLSTLFLIINGVTLTFLLATPCPFSSATYNFVNGSGSITAASTKILSLTQIALLDNNIGTCAGNWSKISDGTPLPCSCNLSISNAGQIKVKGL